MIISSSMLSADLPFFDKSDDDLLVTFFVG